MSEQLKVWWIPQVPGPTFEVPIASVDEAKKVLTVLADYDIFQFDNNIKPDYCNAGGLLTLDGSEWVDWEDDDFRSIDEVMSDEAETQQ